VWDDFPTNLLLKIETILIAVSGRFVSNQPALITGCEPAASTSSNTA
jgi:hypothetical protein